MIELIAIGFVAGIVAGISPCVLPVLPVILVAGTTGKETAPQPGWRRHARPVAVVIGLVVSFSLVILVGSELISALGLPDDFLRDAGIALLVVVGLSFLVPALSTLLERPFARLVAGRQPDGRAGGLVLGLGLGLLFVPCAGPILAAITVAGATHRVGWTAVFLTLAFALGASAPLLVIAIAGNEITRRTSTLRRHAPRARQVAGVVVLAMALLIASNALDGVQRDVPGYTSALQGAVEGSGTVRKQLSKLNGTEHASLASCSSTATKLIDCGPAPNFTGITAWLNTPGNRPLSLAQLRGKVVLVDFWTYSCINCQRTLPHVEAWYRSYAKDGFVVVGVETPEFSFEHVVSNVRTAAAALGVHYPVAVDDQYKTWDAYDNEYWPADYLIDAQGDIRHISFGEGGYTDTQALIRQLLVAAHPSVDLPRPTDVPNKTPNGAEDPETYVGYQREQYIVNTNLTANKAETYRLPSSLPLAALALAGTWTDHAEEATAGSGARMELHYFASDVYLVMAGTGTVSESINGKHVKTIDVGGVPTLHTLVSGAAATSGLLQLSFSPGLQAYDFTFG